MNFLFYSLILFIFFAAASGFKAVPFKKHNFRISGQSSAALTPEDILLGEYSLDVRKCVLTLMKDRDNAFKERDNALKEALKAALETQTVKAEKVEVQRVLDRMVDDISFMNPRNVSGIVFLQCFIITNLILKVL